MRKKLTLVLALLLAVCGVLSMDSAAAQSQSPIGHRQPSAADVPADDSIRGDTNLSGQPQAQSSTKRRRAARTRSEMEVIMKTPNICSNCNQ
ncbi:MAG: hypothetical protein JOZ84_06185 [Methylobacteriaceae bacterium]|nr:hypothetical protein [Methylobacteriaceae bacterium]MBV9393983.1 hypothetical protein [Methylobacteriaceae bacterium]